MIANGAEAKTINAASSAVPPTSATYPARPTATAPAASDLVATFRTNSRRARKGISAASTPAVTTTPPTVTTTKTPSDPPNDHVTNARKAPNATKLETTFRHTTRYAFTSHHPKARG